MQTYTLNHLKQLITVGIGRIFKNLKIWSVTSIGCRQNPRGVLKHDRLRDLDADFELGGNSSFHSGSQPEGKLGGMAG